MHTIMYIDDEESQRGTIARVFRDAPFGHNVAFTTKEPLVDINDYGPMLIAQGVALLIVDQRLSGTAHLEYSGDLLATQVRAILPDLPIWIVTAWRQDVEHARKRDVEFVYSREDFLDVEIMAPRMERAVGRFVDRRIEKLARYSSLSVLAARGVISHEDQTVLSALQEELNLPFSHLQLETRAHLISRLEDYAGELENLLARLQSSEGE